MSTPANDGALRALIDSMDPATLARLKALVDARTATPPPPPADGPATYRGIAVPEVLRPNWDTAEASWWKAGVRSTLDATRKPAGDDDFRWIVRVHWSAEHTSPDVGPFGLSEANTVMRAMRRRFREAGLKPPRITRELLRSPGALDGWITDRIDEAKADDPLRGPTCTDPGCPAGYPHHGPCPGEENR